MIEIGSEITCRFGNGIVIEKVLLGDLIENKCDEENEYDLPYLIVMQKSGNTFHVCEYEAEEIISNTSS